METDSTYTFDEEEFESEFDYLQKLIIYRVANYFHPGRIKGPPPDIFKIKEWQLPLIKFILKYHLSGAEAAILLIGIVSHIKPNLFDESIESKMPPQYPQK